MTKTLPINISRDMRRVHFGVVLKYLSRTPDATPGHRERRTMNHTFIVEPGEWAAAGMMQDESGAETPMRGVARITHARDAWQNESFMEPASGNGPRISNAYAIEPPAEPGAPARWTSHNPALGTLRGRFVFVGDTIVSVFDSETGSLSGTELLKQVDADKYVNVGVLLKNGLKISSWAFELIRKP